MVLNSLINKQLEIEKCKSVYFLILLSILLCNTQNWGYRLFSWTCTSKRTMVIDVWKAPLAVAQLWLYFIFMPNPTQWQSLNINSLLKFR